MTEDEIEDLGAEELIKEYRETVEFRTEERLQGHVSNRQIKLRRALEREILDRMESELIESSNKIEVYEYIRENPDCSYVEVLESVGGGGEIIDALYYLRQSGEIYEPKENNLRVTGEG